VRECDTTVSLAISSSLIANSTAAVILPCWNSSSRSLPLKNIKLA
jgi:hypothetical protein